MLMLWLNGRNTDIILVSDFAGLLYFVHNIEPSQCCTTVCKGHYYYHNIINAATILEYRPSSTNSQMKK